MKKVYSEYVDLFTYDQAISCHPYIDACNASIIARLLENVGFDEKPKRVLDAGSGSGQVARLLGGIPLIEVEACDVDEEARRFFIENPETADIPYHLWDIVHDNFGTYYDAIIIRGVYHHLAKGERAVALQNLAKQGKVVINADEGILEYETPEQRVAHCDSWYGYVIGEARRRKLFGLAELEADYLRHEKLNTADDGGDFKESPREFVEDARLAGLQVKSLDRFGNWERLKGGFYTAVVAK